MLRHDWPSHDSRSIHSENAGAYQKANKAVARRAGEAPPSGIAKRSTTTGSEIAESSVEYLGLLGPEHVARPIADVAWTRERVRQLTWDGPQFRGETVEAVTLLPRTQVQQTKV